MTLQAIELWHKRARPQPTPENFNVQLGCHLEEIVEMLDTIGVVDGKGGCGLEMEAWEALQTLAEGLKKGGWRAHILDRQALLDAMADQIVTSVGVGHCADMATAQACARVNTSNWSKFDDAGQPIFNEHGKITKGPNYQAPDLEGLF